MSILITWVDMVNFEVLRGRPGGLGKSSPKAHSSYTGRLYSFVRDFSAPPPPEEQDVEELISVLPAVYVGSKCATVLKPTLAGRGTRGEGSRGGGWLLF